MQNLKPNFRVVSLLFLGMGTVCSLKIACLKFVNFFFLTGYDIFLKRYFMCVQIKEQGPKASLWWWRSMLLWSLGQILANGEAVLAPGMRYKSWSLYRMGGNFNT